MVEQIERPTEQTPPPMTPDKEAGPTWRRPLVFVLALLAGLVVYAFAFEATDVNLDEIQSETRQESLARILRALAHPELVTYDTVQQITDVAVAIPCGPSVSAPPAGITLDPSCASPGETITIRGEGFEPGENILINFVPRSEFDITLPVSRFQVEDDGTFTIEYEVPDRTSPELQSFQVVTSENIGSWGNRTEVWTDSNENDVEDLPRIGSDGSYTVTLGIPAPEAPAAALLDSARSVITFVSFGEAFEAVSGVVNGQLAVPLAEAGDPEVRVVSLTPADGGTVLALQGNAERDLTGWRLAVYDASTGEQVGADFVADIVELSPRISQTSKDTWEKIVETVMLAFVATTAGLLIAVPLSFLAARNIMKDISSTVTNLTLTLLAVPVGALLGIWLARLVQSLSDGLRDGVATTLLGLVVAAAAIYATLRWALPPVEDRPPSRGLKVARRVSLVAAGIVGLFAFLLLGEVLDRIGEALEPRLGIFDFVGAFFRTLSELIDVLTPAFAALLGAGVLANVASKLGYGFRSRAPEATRLPVNVVLGAASGALWFAAIGTAIDWFYRFENPVATLWIPAAVGAAFGTLMAVRGSRQGQVKIGLTIYYAARTLFNGLRSIEPLVMVIVFVVWVGFGAFAGSLALALHTAAALAKLYSEQVESISQGPIEAVRATGATRLQTIVYAVVPQIVPPYISFTMYRWDINVRMSTILGFAGGGGIGFLLQQNVQLLQYRAAAVQMLAIAIVVASMDYLSARLRERFV